MTIEVLQQRGQSQPPDGAAPGRFRGGGPVPPPPRRDGAADGRQKPSRIDATRPGRGRRPLVAGPGRDPRPTAAAQRPAPPRIPPRRVRLQRVVQVGSQVRAGALRPAPDPPVPPGRDPTRGQTQSDWGEFRGVDLGDPEGPTTVYAFVMVLSHSRKEAVVWSRSMDQLAWHHVHNEAYRRLGGVAAVNRIDNLKTGIAHGCGAWGQINEQYRVYARTMGFHIDACEVRAPEQKGKTERRVGDCKGLDLQGRHFDGLADLQSWTDADRAARALKRICPVTGLSVAASWEAEKPFLRPLPEFLPEPFDLVKTVPVHKDAVVHFEGRSYVIPFLYRPRGGGPRLLGARADPRPPDRRGPDLVPAAHAGADPHRPDVLRGPRNRPGAPAQAAGADGPEAPGDRSLPVERRPVDLYAALAEVAR